MDSYWASFEPIFDTMYEASESKVFCPNDLVSNSDLSFFWIIDFVSSVSHFYPFLLGDSIYNSSSTFLKNSILDSILMTLLFKFSTFKILPNPTSGYFYQIGWVKISVKSILSSSSYLIILVTRSLNSSLTITLSNLKFCFYLLSRSFFSS